MHSSLKVICSVLTIALFLFIGLATSVDHPVEPFLEPSITNTSDSCVITGVRFLTAHGRNTLPDTIDVFAQPFGPGDTIFAVLPFGGYKAVHFTCLCGTDTIPGKIKDLDSNLELIELMCD